MSEDYVEESKRAQDAALQGFYLVSRKVKDEAMTDHEPYPYCCSEHYPMSVKKQKPTGVFISDRILTEEERAGVAKALEYLQDKHIRFEGLPMIRLPEDLKATSNVIELKPGHKYLLVVHGTQVPREAVAQAQRRLETLGITSLSIILERDTEVSVIAVPEISTENC